MGLKKSRILLLVISVFVSLFITTETCLAQRKYMKVDGLKRYYTVHIPKNMKKGTKPALVLLLHGGGGSVKLLMNEFGNRFVRLANRDGAIVVVPEALEKAWSDGRDYKKLYVNGKKADDIKFFRLLIKKLRRNHSINSKKIYVTGPSTGGTMTYRTVLELGYPVAAAAGIIANIPKRLYSKHKNDSAPKTTTSILIMNGTKDPLMPWKGGAVRTPLREARDDVISTAKTVKFWVMRNKCKATPKKYNLKDINKEDGTKTRKYVYTNSKSGTKVILYKITGGGHHFPSKEKGSKIFDRKLSKKILGNKPKDFNSPDVVWNFFKSH